MLSFVQIHPQAKSNEKDMQIGKWGSVHHLIYVNFHILVKQPRAKAYHACDVTLLQLAGHSTNQRRSLFNVKLVAARNTSNLVVDIYVFVSRR